MKIFNSLRHLSPKLRIVATTCLAIWLPATAHAQSEAVEYYGLDAGGSVRIVFDPNGNVLNRMDYGPFGQELAPSPGRQQRIYAGLFVDAEAGLDHAGARSYQSRTGRFASTDPVYPGLFDPQQWNRYSYALNNPLTFADSSGLQVESPSQKCTWVEVATDTGLDTKLSCPQGGGGGGSSGGPSPGMLDMLDWLVGKTLDTFLGTQSLGGADADLQPIVHSGFRPSPALDKAVEVVLIAAAVAAGKVAGATGAAAVESAAGRTAAEELAAAAASAAARVGPGRGAAYGTEVHSAFRAVVDSLGLPGVRTEVSYLNGVEVRWGTTGSVRLDAVQYDAGGVIVQIFDLKTGSAQLTNSRIATIMGNVPPTSRPPINVIRP